MSLATETVGVERYLRVGFNVKRHHVPIVNFVTRRAIILRTTYTDTFEIITGNSQCISLIVINILEYKQLYIVGTRSVKLKSWEFYIRSRQLWKQD